MVNCAIAGCKNYTRITKGTEIRYFRFPRQEDVAKLWITACHRKDNINLKNACICSLHFKPDCFEIPLRQRLLNYNPKNTRILKDNALPTLKLPLTSYDDKQSSARSFRMAKRLSRKVNEILTVATTSGNDSSAAHTPASTSDSAIINSSESHMTVSNIDVVMDRNPACTNMYLNNLDEINKLQERISVLQNENAQLLKQL